MRSSAYVACGLLLLAGCTTHADGTESANKTAIGAVVGSVTGAVIGNRVAGKGSRVQGTVIGAAAGAAVGGGIGYMMDRQAMLKAVQPGKRGVLAASVSRRWTAM
jgi:uncharacterized protein YcfJ